MEIGESGPANDIWNRKKRGQPDLMRPTPCKIGSPCVLPHSTRRSLIAQLVERSTVNRMVAGSSPAQGANLLA